MKQCEFPKCGRGKSRCMCEGDPVTAPTPDAVAQAREALVRVFDAANISARPLTLNDLAAALGLKDYSHSGLADALIAAVRAECAAKVRERAEMMSPYNRQWVEQILAILEAQP